MSTTRAEVKDKGYVKTDAVRSEKKIAIHRKWQLKLRSGGI